MMVTGCSSSKEQFLQLYVLKNENCELKSTDKSNYSNLRFTMLPVTMSEYLDSKSIVYRKSETLVIQTRQNLWAEDIKKQITDRLIGKFYCIDSNYLAKDNKTRTYDGFKLKINFEKFNGSYTGNAEIAGSWEIKNISNEKMIYKEFEFYVPLSSDGYPALVNSLSLGVEMLAIQIYKELENIIS